MKYIDGLVPLLGGIYIVVRYSRDKEKRTFVFIGLALIVFGLMGIFN